MRPAHRSAAFGLCLIGLGLALVPGEVRAQATGQVETVVVNLDHARIIRLPEKTQTVIVGNPIIADVAVQKSGIMVVTAKSFGETNLIALDATGNMLAESKIIVKAARDSVVTVQRGMDRESYACSPACQPAIQLGDNQKFFSETGGQTTARNALAVPSK
jgi:Flp pilus assembly secretin CpaC